jgi:hypothetical protein
MDFPDGMTYLILCLQSATISCRKFISADLPREITESFYGSLTCPREH